MEQLTKSNKCESLIRSIVLLTATKTRNLAIANKSRIRNLKRQKQYNTTVILVVVSTVSDIIAW